MNRKTLALASATLAALAIQTASLQAAPAPSDMEKCYGIVKAGMNDCAASGSHSCAAASTKDAAKNEWVLLPKGSCNKIVGGSLSSKS